MTRKLNQGLYLLLDDGVVPFERLDSLAQAALEGGAAVIQARLKHTADAPALRWLGPLSKRCVAAGVQLIVNDRVDLALLCDADGVHLGDDDLPVDVARRVLGERLIGRTARNEQAIAEAASMGADYVGVGPIFSTQTKVIATPPLELQALASLCRSAALPVVAIGGIDLMTVRPVLACGAHAVAIASDFLLAKHPVSRVIALKEACS
jgi:thiamine-phosphate pyrophosphorylase